jgi:hypothetical protein
LKIDIESHALRLLAEFIDYASTYPQRMAVSMWYCEDAFVYRTKLLKKAYDLAMEKETYRKYDNNCE